MTECVDRRLRQVVNGSRDAYVETDGEGWVTEWSAAAEDLLGWTREEMLGRSAVSVFPPHDAGSVGHGIEVLKSMPPELQDADVPDVFTVKLPLIARDGSTIMTVARIFAVGAEETFRVSAFLQGVRPDTGDVSDPASSDPASSDRLFDPRTRLASRHVFDRRVNVALRSLDGSSSIAVLAIALDRFGVINDALGVEQGDLLLAEVADRLSAVARSRGGPLLARRSGAQFLALFHRTDGRAGEEAERFADRVLRALAAPVVLEGQEVFLTASVGVHATRRSDDDASTLVSNAATAAYESARAGGGQIREFDAAMREGTVERLMTESALHHALERGELGCVYQPLVHVASSSAVGVEALVRWCHPALGTVEPDRFIPVAEESGLIVPIGAWVLEEACRQLALWRARRSCSFGSMAVNLSARQFDDPGLVDLVRRALDRGRLPASSLVCEITESTLMRHAETSLAVLRALKAVGVVIAIDDFGTGYSSLNYLRHFPVDMLKIDKCFVQSIGEPDSVKIVSAIVNLGHELGMTVVAEGVETAVQAQQLRRFGCDLAQGLWYAPPLSVAEVVRSQLLRREA